eukprot:1354301-Amorphochlora_amoeboformis.AAC.2
MPEYPGIPRNIIPAYLTEGVSGNLQGSCYSQIEPKWGKVTDIRGGGKERRTNLGGTWSGKGGLKWFPPIVKVKFNFFAQAERAWGRNKRARCSTPQVRRVAFIRGFLLYTDQLWKTTYLDRGVYMQEL